MRSKTSYFNAAIFWKNIKRFWPLWGSYLAIWCLALPMTVVNATYLDTELEFLEMVLEVASEVGPLMSIAFAVLSAMAVFNFLYSSKSVCMLSALPVRREGLYLTAFTSGLCWLIGANALVTLLGILAGLSQGVVLINAMCQWFAIVSMQILLFYGFACFCAVLTGHLLVLPMVYGVLNFTAVFVEVMIIAIRENFTYGYTQAQNYFTSALSPVVYMLSHMREVREYGTPGLDQPTGLTGVWFEGWGALAVYALVGLLLVLAGLMIFRKRHMETASDVVAVRPLKPVFKYCLAGGCALALGLLLFSIVVLGGNLLNKGSLLALALCMLIGGFVGYFAAEMLVRKSFRVFKNSWKGFVIFSFALLALLLALELDLFGYERKLPDKEDVIGVTVEMNGCYATLDSEQGVDMAMRLHEDLIRNKREVERLINDLASSRRAIRGEFRYILQDGTVMCREYRFPYFEGDTKDPESFLGQADAIINCNEARMERKEMEIPVLEKYVRYAEVNWYDPEMGKNVSLGLTPEEAVELYNTCLVPELENGALGRLWVVTDDEYYSNVYAVTVGIELEKRMDAESGEIRSTSKINSSEESYMYDYFSTTVTVDAVRTAKWLENKGIVLCTEGEIKGIY